MRGERGEEPGDSRRFRGPYAHYDRPAIEAAIDVEMENEIELDVEETGLVDEHSGVRKKPVLDSRGVPPPVPDHAKRRLRLPLARDPRPIDFEDVLLRHPPVSFGGDATVPPSPGIPIFRVLVVEAADRESSITRLLAHAIESLGELGLDLVWHARRSAATMFGRPHGEPGRKSLEPVEVPPPAPEKKPRARKSARKKKEPKMLAKKAPARRARPQKAPVGSASSARGKGTTRDAPGRRKRAAVAPVVVLPTAPPKRGAADLAVRGVALVRRWARAAIERIRSLWSRLGRAARGVWSARHPRSV